MTAVTGLYFFIPICVQCILFVRIYAVYPPLSTSRWLSAAIYGTLLSMTLARVVNLGISLKQFSDTAHLSENPWAVTGVGRRVPFVTVELSMSLVYDTYELCSDLEFRNILILFHRQYRLLSVPLPSPRRWRAENPETF